TFATTSPSYSIASRSSNNIGCGMRRAAVHARGGSRGLWSRKYRRQLVDQALPLDRFLGQIAAWLIEVGSLGLGHRAFALGKALFLELFDRAPHLAQLPGSQADLASFEQKFADPLGQITA